MHLWMEIAGTESIAERNYVKERGIDGFKGEFSKAV